MSSTQTSGRGFFSTLFDIDFTSFLALRFLKVGYAIAIGVTLLVGAIVFLVMLVQGGPSTVFAVVGVPLATLACLVLERLSFELVVQFFRMGENIDLIARQASQSQTPDTEGWPASGDPAGE